MVHLENLPVVYPVKQREAVIRRWGDSTQTRRNKQPKSDHSHHSHPEREYSVCCGLGRSANRWWTRKWPAYLSARNPCKICRRCTAGFSPKKRKRKRRKSQPASANVLRCRRATCYLTRAAAQVSTTVSVHQYSVNKLNDLFIIIIIIIVSFITMLEKKCDSSYSVLYFQ